MWISLHSIIIQISKLKMSLSNQFNFSAGPGALPQKVLEQASQSIIALPETGISVLGMSHRSDWFKSVVEETKTNVRKLLSIPDDYHVLFLQGGSSLQFSMIPMNFLRESNKVAEFIVSGYWSEKAPVQARYEGAANIIWDGKGENFSRLPKFEEMPISKDAAYLHYVSNETVEGLEFSYLPGLTSVPLVCDMASDILSKPIDVNAYSLIYAHAQKNLGPAGVTLVIIKDDFLKNSASKNLPTYFDYHTHINNNSIYNTPPVMAIYVMMLITRWLLNDVGGLMKMQQENVNKAAAIYNALDNFSEVYRGHADKSARSKMNISFFLRDESLYNEFYKMADNHGFYGLEGHRSIGGLRASLYNAVSLNAAEKLAKFLKEFACKYG